MPFVEWKDILIPFNSSTLWFDGTKVDENAKYLGPGYYEIPPAIGPKESPSKAKPRKIVENFNTTQPRFIEKEKGSPGPGDYEGSNQRWFKKSFNMIFAD